ncbi:MAG: hypothetical protein ACYCZF_05505 [Anaerolineae bacterium]
MNETQQSNKQDTAAHNELPAWMKSWFYMLPSEKGNGTGQPGNRYNVGAKSKELAQRQSPAVAQQTLVCDKKSDYCCNADDR